MVFQRRDENEVVKNKHQTKFFFIMVRLEPILILFNLADKQNKNPLKLMETFF